MFYQIRNSESMQPKEKGIWNRRQEEMRSQRRKLRKSTHPSSPPDDDSDDSVYVPGARRSGKSFNAYNSHDEPSVFGDNDELKVNC